MAATVKSARESIRDFNYAWAVMLRALADMLEDTADRFELRAIVDEGRQIQEDTPGDICVCLAPDLFCEVHNA